MGEREEVWGGLTVVLLLDWFEVSKGREVGGGKDVGGEEGFVPGVDEG